MNGKWMLALCLLAPAAMNQSAQSTGAGGADLTFDWPNGMELDKLVDLAKEVTGEPIFYEPHDLKDSKVFFQGKVVVPREKFLSFFEWCMHEVDFVALESMQAGVRVHTLRKLGQQARGQQTLKTMARIVETAELPKLADRWMLVTTTYQCRNLPAREAVTTLQLYFADSATESVRNVEGTDCIVMTGFAANVANIVAMCDRLDAAVGASPEFIQTRSLEKRVAALERDLAALQQGGAKAAGK